MPSPIGHMLAGAATSLAADIVSPPHSPRRIVRRLPVSRELIACAALAAAPDLDLLYPYHLLYPYVRVHRTATHSVTAAVLVFIIVAAVTGKVTRWRTATVCALAYASHLLLDWLATDWSPPRGIELLWPFSDRWFISGLDLFRQTSMRHFFTTEVLLANTITIVKEIVIVLPIVVVLWLVREKTAAGLAAKLSRGHHPAE
jgi:membrane-bound metal-dependent hydrolase YbcI (DUF457 family)